MRIIKGTAPEVLAHAYSKGRTVYFWCDVGGAITGCFRDKCGKLIAVSTYGNHGDYKFSRVYYGMDMNPNNPGKVATLEAMAAYRAEQLAED